MMPEVFNEESLDSLGWFLSETFFFVAMMPYLPL